MQQGEPEEGAAGAQHLLAHRVALGLIAVQKAVGGAAAEHGGQLPAEVGGVLEAGVHALAAGRGVHMGGVAGEEDAADAVLGAWRSSLWKRETQRASCMP